MNIKHLNTYKKWLDFSVYLLAAWYTRDKELGEKRFTSCITPVHWLRLSSVLCLMNIQHPNKYKEWIDFSAYTVFIIAWLRNYVPPFDLTMSWYFFHSPSYISIKDDMPSLHTPYSFFFVCEYMTPIWLSNDLTFIHCDWEVRLKTFVSITYLVATWFINWCTCSEKSILIIVGTYLAMKVIILQSSI